MVKQKLAIKVHFNDSKSRYKALKIAVGVSGVDSAALGGNDKSQIEVVGDIDPVKLITLLRKNLGHAELLSVSVVGEKKEERKEEKKEEKKDEKKEEFMHHMRSRYVYIDQDSCPIM